MPKKVLFVCLGNICRSPMAHGILRHKINQLDLDWDVDSAGTSSFHVGEAPDNRAQSTMLEKGIDISDLKARSFSPNDFNAFDEIYVMDDSNYRDVLNQTNSDEQREKVKLFLTLSNQNVKEVPDPYYGGDSGFEHVYNLLSNATEALISKK